MRGDGMFSTINLSALGTRFELPVFLIMGVADLLTSPTIGRRYFDSITAPAKGFTLLKPGGHTPNQAVLDAQWTVLRDKVAPLLKR